jgi:hypothetical protein
MSNTFLDKPMESGAAVWDELGGLAQEKLSLGPPTLYQEIIHLLALLQGLNQPSRPCSSSGPSLA